MKRSASKALFYAACLIASALSWPVLGAEFASIPPAVHGELDASSDDALIQKLAQSLSTGEPDANLAAEAKERGIGFAVRCATLLDPKRPRAAEVIYDIIARAGRSRGSNDQLVQLYDPAARHLWQPEGAADQASLAVGLRWDRWPGALPEAAVRAAPVSTLGWLNEQAASASPRLAEVRSIARVWGAFVRAGDERQHLPAIHTAIVALGRNAGVLADAPTYAALVRFAGEAKATLAIDLVLAGLKDDAAVVRGEAALAASRLGSADAGLSVKCRQALIARAAIETDVAVAATLAEAAEAFGDDAEMGAAMLALSQRSRARQVDLAILFTVANCKWPQRDAIVLAGLQSKDGGVVGAALQAVIARSTPALSAATLKLFDEYAPPPPKSDLLVPLEATSAQPQLIDAVGAIVDRRATPRLLQWLKGQTNPAIRLKIALALEKIGGDDALAALRDQLEHETDEALMAQLIAIAGRAQIPGADELIASLATDATAPAPLRRAAIASIGYFRTPAATKALVDMSAWPEGVLPTDDPALSAGSSDRVARAALMVAVARLRQGRPAEGQPLSELFEKAPPEGQVVLLGTLADLKRDDAVIARSLASADYAVLFMAVRAAVAADAKKYRPALTFVRDAPFVSALLGSPLDTLKLKATLDAAIAAGGQP